MRLRTRVRDLLHLRPRHVISENAVPLATLDGHAHRGGAELDMHTHARDQLEVRVKAVEQRRLLLEVATAIRSEPIKRLGDGENVEVEAAGGDLQGLVLQRERL